MDLLGIVGQVKRGSIANMADVKIDDAIRDVLENGRTDGTKFFITRTLDRKAYERVNKALENAGGKWNRSAKAHLFPTDAEDAIQAMLSSGTSLDARKLYQAFYTPDDVADFVVARTDVRGYVVLEPSAGTGALVRSCLRAGATSVDCVELQPELANALVGTVGVSSAIAANFLDVNPQSAPKYDRIVMNPPFSKGQDVKHVVHASKFLKSGGVLVTVGTVMLMDKLIRLPEMQEDDIKLTPVPLPAQSFKASGTLIDTVVIVLEKD